MTRGSGAGLRRSPLAQWHRDFSTAGSPGLGGLGSVSPGCGIRFSMAVNKHSALPGSLLAPSGSFQGWNQHQGAEPGPHCGHCPVTSICPSLALRANSPDTVTDHLGITASVLPQPPALPGAFLGGKKASLGSGRSQGTLPGTTINAHRVPSSWGHPLPGSLLTTTASNRPQGSNPPPPRGVVQAWAPAQRAGFGAR